jgi:cytochrome c oxidase subunit 2
MRKVGGWALLVPATVLLSSCSQQDKDEWGRVAMPEGASDRAGHILTFWQWSWLAAIIVGVLVWGLIFFAAFKFRRRNDEDVPVQTRYNLPMEILYTIAPVIVVLVFFKFVVTTQDAVQKDVGTPDHVIKVVGQQWSWTFNYYQDDAVGGQTVFEAGTPADRPTLYLPVDETVQFQLSSPDVVHSFWIPAFNYKMDVIPGRHNTFSLTPTREGSYQGRCAELCGTYHSRMLFNVEVVSKERFTQELKKLQEQGNTGLALGGSDATTQAGLDSDKQTGAGE